MANNGSMTTTEQKSGGIMDMTGGMSGEMAGRLNEMRVKLDLVQQFFKGVMEKDLDYGIIPGTQKPSLLKPGAEKLCELYGFAPVVKEKKETRDFNTGYYLAELTMQVVHRQSGSIIAEGVGEASSYESKYRFRWLFDNELPKNVDKSGLIQKTFASKNGKEYTKYRTENIDLIDQWNTVLKMAKKRALVDAVLSATRTSGIFSQSEDEMDAWIEGETDDKLEKVKSAPKAADEKSPAFNPSASGGIITLAQRNKIQYDAEKKHVKAEDIEAIVKSTKQKPIAELTKAEASAVIDWLGKISESELQDLVIETTMDGMDGGK
jgi:hypothetical protein